MLPYRLLEENTPPSKNIELVGKIFLGTFSNNECETGWVLYMFWLCDTVLNFNSDRFFKNVGTGYPVDPTNTFCVFWELELPRERGFDVKPTFILTEGKGMVRKVHLEAKSSPIEALSPASVCEGGVVNDLNTSQVA